MQVNKPIYTPPPPGTPLPMPDLSDIDQIHKTVFGGTLADALHKLSKKAK